MLSQLVRLALLTSRAMAQKEDCLTPYTRCANARSIIPVVSSVTIAVAIAIIVVIVVVMGSANVAATVLAIAMTIAMAIDI
jgi:hypothetical protein